jgi:cation diffusion facilitator CzcD-associated flavoprotein CzcO
MSDLRGVATSVDRHDDASPPARFDVIVIGAGFSSLYMLHKLRRAGITARALEIGDGVGGTWYWNRYPGARVDVESIEYSYSFSDEIQEEWVWSEVMAAQPEIEAYLNFVADRLELRGDIQLCTRVTSLDYAEPEQEWHVGTDVGDRFTARFVVAATGCLSAPLEPDIAGLASFEGTTVYTNRFPKDGFDFTNKRVAVIGTGSSGVQTIPVIAEQAEHLYVFQRSAAYTRPANNRPWGPGELDALKADYPNIRARQRESFAGALRFGAVSLGITVPPDRKILETPMSKRMEMLDELGWLAPSAWADVMSDLDANKAGAELYAELIRRVVKDPDTAQSLVPHYPIGCKRAIIDTGYFETFNRDNVSLVDLRIDPIIEITATGIRTERSQVDLDVIVLATGFDAMTGALNRIDIRGRDGRLLRDVWADGPVTYLGLQVAGFPNLFMVTGPGSPSVRSNMVVSIEQHVDWIVECLEHLRSNGLRSIEATREAQFAWVEHVASLVIGSVMTSAGCNSWYLGANVPGKTRIYMPYYGGIPTYRRKCEEIVAAGYEGFVLT